jgi:hypothetical protein
MLENYITPSKDTPSRSGLYANQLPGVTLNLLDDLTKDEQEDWEEFWSDIYDRSCVNFAGDVQAKLADKFHIDLKLLSRETSSFKEDVNVNSGLAGIKLEYNLPKYGRLNIITIEVTSESEVEDVPIYFYDTDGDGKLLHTETVDIVSGLNTIHIDESFDVDKLFIAFDSSSVSPGLSFRETKNRYFSNCHYFHFSDLSCLFPCHSGSNGSVTQVNGGGINVIYNATCSIEKLIEDNINIFRESFWYRIGLELMRERVFSDRFNRWTTMSAEDAAEKQKTYMDECDRKLNNAVQSLRIKSDPVCFMCKSTVSSTYITP